MPAADAERLAARQEMTISREAFARNLPGAVGHEAFRVEGDAFVHDAAAPRWRIRLVGLPDLAVGALRLERHAVEIRLCGFDDAGERGFLDRFERNFRRGGG